MKSNHLVKIAFSAVFFFAASSFLMAQTDPNSSREGGKGNSNGIQISRVGPKQLEGNALDATPKENIAKNPEALDNAAIAQEARALSQAISDGRRSKRERIILERYAQFRNQPER